MEKNFGNGAFLHVWLPVLREKWQCAVSEEWASGQKELRIIDTIEPVLARRQLVFLEDILTDDPASLSRYSSNVQATYSVFTQMARITRDSNCLTHDDRLDALHWGVRYWVKTLATDQQQEIARRRQQEYEQWQHRLLNPTTINYADMGHKPGSTNLFTSRRRTR